MGTSIAVLSVMALACLSQAALGLGVDHPNGSPQLPVDVVMGDLKLTDEQRLAVKRGLDVGVAKQHGYAATNDAFKPWPNAVIPYEIDCSLEFMSTAIMSIKEAMAAWEAVTCLRFVERTNEKDYLRFFRNTHCWGNVGRLGGRSQISVGDGCDYKHVMEHEIGHAIGFWHEQNRKDRDNYVQIKWDNIENWVKDAFDLVNDTDSLGIPYDYASIMHYPWNAFSKNGHDTMIPLKPVAIQPYLGVSQLDAQQISLMYNCPAVTMKRSKEGRSSAYSADSVSCVDQYPECPLWHSWGHCSKSPTVMKSCPKSCNPACDTMSCVDQYPECPLWHSWGHCSKNPTVMKSCPKSCNPACDTSPTSVPTTASPGRTTASPTKASTPGLPYTGTLPTTSSGSLRLGIGLLCEDTHQKCASWASAGECTRNPGYMQRECKLSCNMTDCDRSVPRPPGACSEPLGLSFDGKGYKIPDANMKAASFLSPGSNWMASAHNARLYFVDDHKDKRIGAWCVASWDDYKNGAFIEIDLGQTRRVRYIATQGRHKYFERVDKFKISYSMDGINFQEYQENGKAREFDGNCDHFTPILNQFNSPMTTRHIRLYPTSANYPCIRMEFFGC